MTLIRAIKNCKGETTHIQVGCDILPREDAIKVIHGSVEPEQVTAYVQKWAPNATKESLIEFIADILNQKEDIYNLKTKILGLKK